MQMACVSLSVVTKIPYGYISVLGDLPVFVLDLLGAAHLTQMLRRPHQNHGGQNHPHLAVSRQSGNGRHVCDYLRALPPDAAIHGSIAKGYGSARTPGSGEHYS